MLKFTPGACGSSPRDKRRAMSAKRTKKKHDPRAKSLREMPEVTDWSRARRGYWAGRLRRSTHRTLAPDLAKVFPDDESVNAALRIVVQAAKAVTRRRRSKAA